MQALQHELLNYVVLDPACGSGNFLYTAYRELRRLERRLHDREQELRRAQGRRGAEQGALATFFPLTNIKGIEIDPFAVSLARVTLWMGHKLAVDELDLDEATLPLGDLSAIQTGDALRVQWPKASVIVGNPPFHGDRNLAACSAATTSSGSSASLTAASRTTASTGFARPTTTSTPAIAPAWSAPTRSPRTARDRPA